MLALASAVLLLSLTIGIDFKASNGLLPVKLESSTWINEAFTLGVIYFFIQTNLFWATQNLEIKTKIQYKIDYYLTNSIAVIALVAWITPWIQMAIKYIYLTYNVPSLSEGIGANIFTLITLAATGALASKLIGRLIILVMKSKAHSGKVENDLLGLLPSNRWVLVFNPASQKAKEISFEEDGSIGEGKNKNEDHWRVRGEFLEILNSEGTVFSRFRFNKRDKNFEHTNDDDTLSIRSQKIIPKQLFAGIL